MGSAESAICTGVQICADYDVDCNFIKDGFCPQTYGDWGACDMQSYGKCSPCDSDCGSCGSIEIITAAKANPGATVEITVIAHLSGDKTDEMQLLEGTDLSGQKARTSNCAKDETTCLRKFSYTVSSTGGDTECFTATTSDLRSSNIKATNCIQINPAVVLTATGTNNIIPLNARVQSLQEVAKGEIYLFKKDPRTDEFKPVNMNNPTSNDYCSFRCSGTKNCNLLFSQDVSAPRTGAYDFRFDWDSRKCDNMEFKIKAYGFDSLGNFNDDESTLTLNNENPPCIDQCYPFNSELLNTVYLKIKSWIS